MSEIGDNSMAADERLRLLIERIEAKEVLRKEVADDIRDDYTEAKAVGYDIKAMRAIIKLRKMNPDDRREQQAILETYVTALGLDLL